MTTPVVTIGQVEIGKGGRCFITAESGPTHSGIASAKALVSHAAEVGADAVKFQLLDPDRLVADRKQMFSYDVLVDRATGRTETVSEPLYDILCRRTLTREEWRELKSHCDQLGIAFFSTAMFDDEIDFLVSIGTASIKIASGDLNHHPLLRKAARTGLNLQLDTGNGTIGEMEAAIDIIRREGNENIIIHHCPSGYPAHLPSINLRVIDTLRRMFPYPVAYSDHTPGWDMDIAAIALGATLIEKTITLDVATRSVEHVMSLEPEGFGRFVKAVRDLEVALGRPRREMSAAELEKRLSVRRSIFIANPVTAGTRLADAIVEFRRPGTGLGPDLYDLLRDRSLKRDLAAGHMLTLADLG